MFTVPSRSALLLHTPALRSPLGAPRHRDGVLARGGDGVTVTEAGTSHTLSRAILHAIVLTTHLTTEISGIQCDCAARRERGTAPKLGYCVRLFPLYGEKERRRVSIGGNSRRGRDTMHRRT